MTIKVLPKEPVTAEVSVSVGNLVTPAQTAVNYVIDATDGTTELNILLPNHTKSFSARPRRAATMRLAYAATGTDDDNPYSEVPPGNSYSKDLLDLTGQRIYFRVDVFPNVIEITAFV